MNSVERTGIDIEEWYDRYGPMVLRRCRSILGYGDEALDVMQDVFVEVLRRRDRIYGDFPSSFLYTIATNLCLNRLRRRREWTVEQETLEAIPSIDEGIERFEAGEAVRAVFTGESESTRLIAWLYHVDGLTLAEVGKAVGLSISGVRKRLLGLAERARKRMAGGGHGTHP